MAEKKADTATTKDATETKQTPRQTKAAAAKSAKEAENLPGASAPSVTAEVTAKRDDTTLTSTEAQKIENPKTGDFGPFVDSAPPVGAALEATTAATDTAKDFDINDLPITVNKGDVVVAARVHNQRAIVEISPAGWTGPGQQFAPYQLPALKEAIAEIEGHLHSL